MSLKCNVAIRIVIIGIKKGDTAKVLNAKIRTNILLQNLCPDYQLSLSILKAKYSRTFISLLGLVTMKRPRTIFLTICIKIIDE